MPPKSSHPKHTSSNQAISLLLILSCRGTFIATAGQYIWKFSENREQRTETDVFACSTQYVRVQLTLKSKFGHRRGVGLKDCPDSTLPRRSLSLYHVMKRQSALSISFVRCLRTDPNQKIHDTLVSHNTLFCQWVQEPASYRHRGHWDRTCQVKCRVTVVIDE